MVSRALRTRMASAKADVRRFLDGIDNEEVRQARRLARRLRRGRADVVHLGNSTVEWVAPGDADRRPLHRMIADSLADPQGSVSVHGGSYGPRLHAALAEFSMRFGRPKVFLVPLWYRGQFRPWQEHPIFSRRRAADAIAELPAGTPTWWIRRGFPRPTEQEWRHYAEIPWDTFAGLPTVGEHVRRLKDPVFNAEQPAERTRLLYAYHQTHRLDPAVGDLEDLERLGRTLAATGVPIVLYQTPVPVEHGVELWGDRFREVAAANYDLLTEHFCKGYGSDVPLIDTGLRIPGEEFLDLEMADEHLNERGRARLAREIVDGIGAIDPALVRQPRS